MILLRRLLLWLAPASGLFLMGVSCIPIAHREDYHRQAMAERGDPYYSASQIGDAITPYLVFVWVGLVTVFVVIAIVWPMRGPRSGPGTVFDRVFTIGSMVLIGLPMMALIQQATDEGAQPRGIGYIYQPWYVPMLVAGTIVYLVALIGALYAPRRPAATTG